MKIRTYLVDDEANNLEALKSLLAYIPEIELMGACQSPLEAYAQLEELKPDLLFLDIMMPGLDGFELLERLSKPPIALIFTTAASDQAIRAFKVEAVDYLLKPILFSDLKNAVAKAQKKISAQKPTQTEVLTFSTSQGIELVRVEDIIRVEGEGSYSTIISKSGAPLLVSRNLGDLEAQLTARGFLRVHTSHLINPAFLVRYLKDNNGTLLMADQVEVPVSRRRKEELLDWLKGLA